MHDFPDKEDTMIEGCVYHTIEVLSHRRFKIEVYRGGTMRWDDVTDEPIFEGGDLVATLYRPTEGMAHEAGITYSFVTAGREKFRGTRGPKYGRSLHAA